MIIIIVIIIIVIIIMIYYDYDYRYDIYYDNSDTSCDYHYHYSNLYHCHGNDHPTYVRPVARSFSTKDGFRAVINPLTAK